jgi:tetratricopeptide (TPR) repeat protein
MRAVIVSILAAFAVLAAPARAEAPRRVALVIGNEAYQSLARLDNPRLDAGRLAALLAANGFDVMSCDGRQPGCFDLKREGLQDALERFRDKANGADLALMFYAGHGMEGRDGNVLAPIDTEVTDCVERALRRGVPLDALFKAVAGARRKIVILDACRNDPFAQCPPMRGARPASFAPLTAPESESFLLVLSTKPGQVALDGPPGAHSPYMQALLAWLEKEPAVYFHDVLSHTAKEVIEDTSRANFTQVPEMLARGELPVACLKGGDCVGDARAAALTQEVDALRQEHARDQELKAIVGDYLAAAEKDRPGRPLTEEEKRQELMKLKQVSDAIAEVERGRGRPFSSEERAQELQRLMEAGRALIALNTRGGERALERLKAGDESEAKRLFAEDAAAHRQAAQLAKARAAAENREAAKALRHLAAIARPKNVAEAADTYKEAASLDPADAQAWIDYAHAASAAGRSAEARAAYAQADARARENNDLLVRYRAAEGLGDLADPQLSGADEERYYRTALALAEEGANADLRNPVWQRALALAHGRIGGMLTRQGKPVAAVASYRAALAIAERLAAADPGNGELQQTLVFAHSDVGDALAAQHTFAQLGIGKPAEPDPLSGALLSYRAALAIAERSSKTDPDNSEWVNILAFVHGAIGAVEEAQGNLDASLASRQTALAFAARNTKSDPSNIRWQTALASAHSRIGSLLEKRGDRAGALKSYQAARAVEERLTGLDPGNTMSPRVLAVLHSTIGNLLFGQGDLAGALASYGKAAAIYRRQIATDAGNGALHANLGLVDLQMGRTLEARGDLTGALASFRDAIARYDKADPASPVHQGSLWAAHSKVGQILQKQGDLAGALASYRAMQEATQNRIRIDPANPRYRSELAMTHRVIGAVLWKQGDLADALSSYRAALATEEELLASEPANSRQHLARVAGDHYTVGEILRARNDLAGALASYRAALAGYGTLDPDATATQESLRNAHNWIGYVLYAQGDLAGALASYETVLALNERLAAADPGNGARQGNLWTAHAIVGSVLQDLGRLADALASFAAAQDIAERRSKADPGDAAWQRNLAASYAGVAGARLAKGDRAGARALWRRALGVVEASAAAIERDETKGAGKPGAKTAEALGSVAWHALLARNFRRALAASERAHKLAPDVLWPEINRAHALLLLRRPREARALYLAHKGKMTLNQRWERVIADDFHALRRAGLTHPAMRRIEVALGVALAPAARPAVARKVRK